MAADRWQACARRRPDAASALPVRRRQKWKSTYRASLLSAVCQQQSAFNGAPGAAAAGAPAAASLPPASMAVAQAHAMAHAPAQLQQLAQALQEAAGRSTSTSPADMADIQRRWNDQWAMHIRAQHQLRSDMGAPAVAGAGAAHLREAQGERESAAACEGLLLLADVGCPEQAAQGC